MAPSPQEQLREEVAVKPRPAAGEEVVISGLSGIFPMSDSVEEFSKNLYNKVDMVTTENPRWVFNHPEVPKHIGKINGVGKFDAQFFRVHYKQAATMEPMSTKLLEHAYSAIYDSGINPLQLRGKKVGVFIGATHSESEKIVIYENVQRNGFGITGCNKAMYANRISYWIDGKGPSYSLDLACASSTACIEHAYRSISSGQCDAAIVGGCNLCMHPNVCLNFSRFNKAMYANRISYSIDGKGLSYSLDLACASSTACIEHAYRSISSGQCDAAIVGGCNLCMHPNVCLNFSRAGFLTLDGKTKCFDKNGDGHVRSDAINVLFLQKAKDAKRIYSEVYYAKCSYSPSSKQLLPVREPKELAQFLEEFYSDIDVSPEDVEYVEANGAAFAEADANELTAIGRVFGKDHPIKVGCVKSNMGSSEPASGVCGTMKVCLAFQHGKLPGNLHYENPLDIPEVKDGKIQILTDTTNFNGRFAALNSFSNGGANVHVLLKRHYKEKDNSRYKSSIPHLILLSGRNEDCIAPLMENLKQRPIDPEEIGLLHSIHQFDIPGHMSRGFTILEKNAENKTICLSQSVEYCPGTTRPLWFVYSGMGSQWATMGAELMRIPVFAAAIQKCNIVLEPKGIDIVRILTEPDKKIYDNILHSFVGIAAVQIGLTDILTEMGIVPDNIIGHSVGELGCAYADGCFTAEEMILSAYSRGLVSVQTPFIRGSMAAVGLGYKAILPLCPPGIEVACHNSSESATISGPADIMKEFVADLISRGIFAKEVPCSNIAYHSKYIADAGPALLEYLSEVIQEPKARSNKWVSTSVPEEKWDEPNAQYSSAEYHTNNLLNPVLFEEASKHIPADALVIEIAPHGLLQAILKRSLSECLHVPLTRRGTADSVKFLLEAVGKLYQAGLNPKVDMLYPKIAYPVSTGTPLLSQHVGWEHSENWPQARYSNKDRQQTLIRSFVMSLHDDEFSFLKGHVRKGYYVFPEAAILQLVWENLAMHRGVKLRELSVSFKEVHFLNEAIIKYDEQLRLEIMINKGSRRFEVTKEGSVIASGFIFELNAVERHQHESEENADTDPVKLTTNDIYTMMRLKGYLYEGDFQSIDSANSTKTKANIKWNDNWTCFIDSIFQLNAFAKNEDRVLIPSHITKLYIDVDKHNAMALDGNNIASMSAYLNNIQDSSKCGGVNVIGLVFKQSKLLEHSQSILLNQQFVPHFVTGLIKLKSALQINLQLVADNVNKDVKVIDLLSKESAVIKDLLNECSSEIPFANFALTSQTEEKMSADKTDLIITDNLLGDDKKMNNIHKTISSGTFILTIEKDTAKIHPKYKLFHIITAMSVGKQIVILLRKVKYCGEEDKISFLPITLDKNFSWISKVQAELTTSQEVVLISESQPFCGMLGMVKKLRKEYGNRIRLVIVDDCNGAAFSVDKNIYKDQLQKNLAYNVMKKGQWGGYYYISDSSENITSQNLQLRSAMSADVESLTWVEEPVTSLSNMRVKVCYTGPSFRDAQNAASRSHFDGYYGMDFSGIAKSGERVMGLISKGAIASTVDADPDLIWPVPEHWTLEDAATVPLPYILSYYCLSTFKFSFLSEMKQVFIHGGAGALGQAFISICLSRGYTVHTSVRDNFKKRFLLKLFPGLEEKNIVASNDICYIDTIKSNTKSGCSLVINCASGEQRRAVQQIVGYEGMFMDLSDHDMLKDEEFQMGFLTFARHYQSIKLDNIFKPEFAMDKKKLKLQLSEGIATGVVRPLSRVVYSPVDVDRAFRLLATSQHRGKVLLRMEGLQAAGEHLKVKTRMAYSSTGPYIVVSDDETILGMELADTLIKHGATKILLCLKPTQLAGFCYSKFSTWKDLNVTVKLSTENVQTEKGCVKLLQDASKLGPILGIFVVQNFSGPESLELGDVVAKFNNTTGVVANLDLTSRKICNDLNHFVVVSHSKSDGGASDEYMTSSIDSICNSRKDAGLPALSFHINSVKELDHGNPEKSRSSLKTILSDLETSLRLNHTVAASVQMKKHDVLLLQKLSNVIGADINKMDENLSFESFLQHDDSLSEICSLINEAYDTSYSVEKILKLRIADLKNLENIKSRDKTKLKDGFDAFFSYIDADECRAAEPGVFMSTACSCVQDEEELDPKDTYLMLMPGFEGHHEVFTTLCERLKVQAVAFQYGPEHTYTTVPETARLILQFIKKRIELKTKFYLLGYSFGVNVALEVARLLEMEGHEGVIFCVDGSPSFLRKALGAHLGTVDELSTVGAIQDRLATHMYSLMDGGEATTLERSLATLPTWEHKVDACVDKLRGVAKFSNQYKRCILQGAYNRIVLAEQYEPAFCLRSELVLIKATPHPNMESLPHDYGLSRYSTAPVRVFQVDVDHATIPYDCRVTSIVNRLLDPNLIEAFKNKNVCDTYVANPIKGW